MLNIKTAPRIKLWMLTNSLFQKKKCHILSNKKNCNSTNKSCSLKVIIILFCTQVIT